MAQSSTEIFSTYCERSLPGVWEEPLNAVSNLAFLIAAVLILRVYIRNKSLPFNASWDLCILIFLLFSIAIGSALWHTLPSKGTELADAIPILIFIDVYLLSFLYRITAVRWYTLAALFIGFHGLNFLVSSIFPAHAFNGSVFYAPAWLTLILMSIYLLMKQNALRWRFSMAAGLFTLSLLCRTVDRNVCEWVPVGTHFIWHILNAGLLYLMTSVLIAHATNRNSMQRPVRT
ncbi:ceramidase domain-containing protein [Kaarinaea lacus]